MVDKLVLPKSNNKGTLSSNDIFPAPTASYLLLYGKAANDARRGLQA